MPGGINMPENYNQLVLSQLQSLSQAIEALRGDLQFVRQEIAELKAKEDKVVELREWKQKVDEVASPTQLAKLVQDIQDLNNFKTKAVTIFAVVQFAMGAVLFAMNFIN
jgi:DNA repair exonuclease SbcCD ATPase subunit